MTDYIPEIVAETLRSLARMVLEWTVEDGAPELQTSALVVELGGDLPDHSAGLPAMTDGEAHVTDDDLVGRFRLRLLTFYGLDAAEVSTYMQRVSLGYRVAVPTIEAGRRYAVYTTEQL